MLFKYVKSTTSCVTLCYASMRSSSQLGGGFLFFFFFSRRSAWSSTGHMQDRCGQNGARGAGIFFNFFFLKKNALMSHDVM